MVSVRKLMDQHKDAQLFAFSASVELLKCLYYDLLQDLTEETVREVTIALLIMENLKRVQLDVLIYAL